MEAKDLRVGNLVYTLRNGEKKVVAVTPESIFSLSVAKEQEEFFPIPKERYWLDYFGFEESGMYFATILLVRYQGIEVRRNPESPEEWLVYLANEDMGFITEVSPIFLKEIRYVHQLQNLYFALTGQELETRE